MGKAKQQYCHVPFEIIPTASAAVLIDESGRRGKTAMAALGPGRVKTLNLVFSLGVRGGPG